MRISLYIGLLFFSFFIFALPLVHACTIDSDCSNHFACNVTSSICYSSCSSDSYCAADASCVTSGRSHLRQCITCNDSDAGQDPFVAGQLSNTVWYSTSEYASQTSSSYYYLQDRCDGAGDLMEYFCWTSSSTPGMHPKGSFTGITCSTYALSSTCVTGSSGSYCSSVCSSDSDCASYEVCDVAYGDCVQCERGSGSSGCGTGEACTTDGTCAVDLDYNGVAEQDESGTCSAMDTTECDAQGYACYEEGGYCYFECAGDTDCSSGYVCRSSACLIPCEDSSCGSYTCDTRTNLCKTACSSTSDCTSGYACVSGACISSSSFKAKGKIRRMSSEGNAFFAHFF